MVMVSLTFCIYLKQRKLLLSLVLCNEVMRDANRFSICVYLIKLKMFGEDKRTVSTMCFFV